MVDFVRYYDLERYLFEDVHQRFHAEHSIGAFDLFSIVIWKANRAKSRIGKRLLGKHGDLEGAARRLSAALWDAPNGEARLRVLMSEWGFLLPMASAILTVLWPDEFTVYDVRACETLADHGHADFSDLVNRSAESVWADGYDAFRESVRRTPPAYLSLRDKDRYLWGYSRAEQLKRDIQSGFER